MQPGSPPSSGPSPASTPSKNVARSSSWHSSSLSVVVNNLMESVLTSSPVDRLTSFTNALVESPSARRSLERLNGSVGSAWTVGTQLNDFFFDDMDMVNCTHKQCNRKQQEGRKVDMQGKGVEAVVKDRLV